MQKIRPRFSQSTRRRGVQIWEGTVPSTFGRVETSILPRCIQIATVEIAMDSHRWSGMLWFFDVMKVFAPAAGHFKFFWGDMPRPLNVQSQLCSVIPSLY